MKKLPPIDIHAHISTNIKAIELEKLGAVTFIATRSMAEFEEVTIREDRVSVWGIGCHPSLVRVQRDYDPLQFELLLHKTAYVAEVGIDGDSRVPLERQQDTLRSILRITKRHQRMISIHSYKATELVLRVLEETGSQNGQILHWWLGDYNETKRAIELGCYFSINYSMARSNDTWRIIPVERILTETDHPFGDRFSSAPRQPGKVGDVEKIIAKNYNISVPQLRIQLWRNFKSIVESTNIANLMPDVIQNMINAVDN